MEDVQSAERNEPWLIKPLLSKLGKASLDSLL